MTDPLNATNAELAEALRATVRNWQKSTDTIERIDKSGLTANEVHAHTLVGAAKDFALGKLRRPAVPKLIREVQTASGRTVSSPNEVLGTANTTLQSEVAKRPPMFHLDVVSGSGSPESSLPGAHPSLVDVATKHREAYGDAIRQAGAIALGATAIVIELANRNDLAQVLDGSFTESDQPFSSQRQIDVGLIRATIEQSHFVATWDAPKHQAMLERVAAQGYKELDSMFPARDTLEAFGPAVAGLRRDVEKNQDAGTPLCFPVVQLIENPTDAVRVFVAEGLHHDGEEARIFGTEFSLIGKDAFALGPIDLSVPELMHGATPFEPRKRFTARITDQPDLLKMTRLADHISRISIPSSERALAEAQAHDYFSRAKQIAQKAASRQGGGVSEHLLKVILELPLPGQKPTGIQPDGPGFTP